MSVGPFLLPQGAGAEGMEGCSLDEGESQDSSLGWNWAQQSSLLGEDDW